MYLRHVYDVLAINKIAVRNIMLVNLVKEMFLVAP